MKNKPLQPAILGFPAVRKQLPALCAENKTWKAVTPSKSHITTRTQTPPVGCRPIGSNFTGPRLNHNLNSYMQFSTNATSEKRAISSVCRIHKWTHCNTFCMVWALYMHFSSAPLFIHHSVPPIHALPQPPLPPPPRTRQNYMEPHKPVWATVYHHVTNRVATRPCISRTLQSCFRDSRMLVDHSDTCHEQWHKCLDLNTPNVSLRTQCL